MSDKNFGVKQINIISGSGTPTITSPNNLNLNAVNVAVSTDLSVGGSVSVGGTISVDGGVQLVTNNPTIVGTSGTTGEIKQIGGAPFYYDGSAWREFVLSSGTPVTVPADTDWDNVILRTTFDTSFDDAKFGVSPVAVGGGSTIVASPLKIGSKSFRNDGSVGAGISYAYRSEYDFTGAWTIEFWMYHDAIPADDSSLVSMISFDDTGNNWTFGLAPGVSSVFWYWDNEQNANAKTLFSVANSTFNTSFVNTWTHYALVREADNGSLHLYVNGTESPNTYNDSVIDNNISNTNGAGLYIGGLESDTINGTTWNSTATIDANFDDLRITTNARYTSIGSYLSPTFTPPTSQLPITGTLSSYIQPPGDKYGEIGLGTSPTWRGTSGVTVSQQSSGNYRVSFASTYTDSNDYYVLSQGMDQGFASYVGIARSTTHVDFSINKQSDDTAVDTGALAVQIKNHI